MSYYELSFLLPNLNSGEREDILKKIEDKIKNLGGKIEEDFIEKKFFAYPVKKHTTGFLGIVNFYLEGEKLPQLRNFLKLNEKILREMIEKLKITKAISAQSEKIKAKKVPEKKKKVKIEEIEKKLEEILK